MRKAPVAVRTSLKAVAMELSPRAISVLSVLNDLKDAFMTLLRKPNKHPALLMMYTFIDICAALSNDEPSRNNQEIFIAYLDAFQLPDKRRTIPPIQLWAARSALLHTFSPLGRHTASGKARATFYYAHNENQQTVHESLVARGYTDVALLSIDEIKGIAIWAFNGMFRKVERCRDFHDVVVRNAEHLLLTQDDLAVERFMTFLQENRVDADGQDASSRTDGPASVEPDRRS